MNESAGPLILKWFWTVEWIVLGINKLFDSGDSAGMVLVVAHLHLLICAGLCCGCGFYVLVVVDVAIVISIILMPTNKQLNAAPATGCWPSVVIAAVQSYQPATTTEHRSLRWWWYTIGMCKRNLSTLQTPLVRKYYHVPSERGLRVRSDVRFAHAVIRMVCVCAAAIKIKVDVNKKFPSTCSALHRRQLIIDSLLMRFSANKHLILSQLGILISV